MLLEEKVQRLQQLLRSYEQVAVAFSGGADSSLLLKIALDTLGAGNVLGLFARSILLKQAEIDRALNWPADHGFADTVTITCVDLQPLQWQEFVGNDPQRCYFCKLRIYSHFLETMEKQGMSRLLDGTNSDDLSTHRAGLRAIHQLGVKTPLLEAGLDKAEIRLLGKQLGLNSWNRPAGSCLATRIATGTTVSGALLQQLAFWEEQLEKLGFAGCRVRLTASRPEVVSLEIQNCDFDTLLDTGIRLAIHRMFQKSGIQKVLLDLEGRVG